MEAAPPPVSPVVVSATDGCKDSDLASLATKNSWANIVKDKPTLSKHNFDSLNASGVVEVPQDVLEDTPLWDDLLIGQFITSAPHIAKIHVIVNKIWPLGDKSIKIDVFVVSDKLVKFRVKNAAVRSRILRRGMWNIADVPMLVSKWTPVIEDAQPVISKMPIWVTIKNVPHKMFSWKGLSFLASKVGDPKRLHPETETCKMFDEAKIFVEVDMMKELPKKFKFEIEKGEEAVVEYIYPWLPPRCSVCEKWGHFADSCKTIPSITILKRGETESITTEPTPEIVQQQPPTTKTQESEGKDLELTPQVMKLVGSSSTGKESEKISEKATEQSWIPISPNKAGRLKEQCPSSPITSTPSRFSVLGDDEVTDLIAESDKAAEPEIIEGRTNWEEGEIKGDMLEKAQVQETEDGNVQCDDVMANDETGLRLSLKRASKTAHRVLAGTPPQRNTHSKNQASRANKKKK